MAIGDFNPVQSPDAGQTINTILGIQAKQQALQTGQYTQQSAQASAQNDSRIADEQSRIAAYVSNPANKDKKAADMADDINAIAPTTGADYLSKRTELEQKETDLKSAQSKLSEDNKGYASKVFTSLIGGTDTPDVVASKLKMAAQLNPQTADVMGHYADLVDHLPPPGPQRDAMLGQVVQSLGGQTGQTPTTVQQRTATSGGVQNQRTGAITAAGPSYTPASVQNLPNGQLGVVSGNGIQVLGGGATPGTTQSAPPQGAPGAGQRPRTAADDAPGPNAPQVQRDAYNKASAEAQQHVADVRKADADYGNNVSISNTIRHLASDTSTGPGSEPFHQAMASMGMQGGTNYQELGAFLDRQAAGLRSQMGLPGTNAGADESKAIAGNTTYTRQAILDKNDYTQSLVEGAHQYRHGLDRIEGFTGQASPKAVQQFRSAWAENFDPNVYKLDIAKKQGKDALNKFVSSLDPQEAASLSQKRKNLQALSNGQIPQ